MGAWHTYSAQQAIAELETDRTRGLTQAEAERRLERYGPNRLERGRRPGLLRRLWGQLTDPMILVLLAAAGLSLWAGGGEDWLDAAIILVIVVVNACISLSQEDSARRALEALRDMSAPLARVVRDGEELIRLDDGGAGARGHHSPGGGGSGARRRPPAGGAGPPGRRERPHRRVRAREQGGAVGPAGGRPPGGAAPTW